MNQKLKSHEATNFVKPEIGEKVKPRFTVRAINLKAGQIHTVTDVQYPMFEGERDLDAFLSDGWWIKTDLANDDWYAQTHFQRA